jgi:exopolysaccharide biosynthesis polyprenyl glycosylphosphotransferase
MGSDALIVFVGFYLAYWLRYTVHLGGEVSPSAQQPFSFFQGKIVLLMALVVLIFQLRGLYRLPRWTTLLDEAFSIASGATTAMALVVLYSFLQRFYPSRLIFIYAWLLVIGLLVAKRLVGRVVRERLWLRGIGVDRVVIVGSGRAGQRMMQWLIGQPQLGYQVVGFLDDTAPPENWGIATDRRVVKPRHLGTCADVRDVVQAQRIDEVIIALPPTAHEQMVTIMNQCRADAIEFKLVPDLFELAMDHVNIHEVAGLPMIGMKPARISGANFLIKRSIDIIVSMTVLAFCSIPMALFAIAIKLDSEGPVLFRQERVGRDGRRFICYKFRTMIKDAESQQALLQQAYNVDGRLTKVKDDPRRTRVGKILRRTSLDELPQFVNVLLGEMSVVGPRPPVPAEVAEYDEWHHDRLLVTPGLTGLWQVSGRSNLTFDEMVRLDLYYAEHWSPWLDIKIMMRTIPAILTARGAY